MTSAQAAKSEPMMVRLTQTEADKVRHIALVEDRSNSQVMRLLISKALTSHPTGYQTIDFIGYSKEHGCYVFNDIAIFAGQCHQLDQNGTFDLGAISIKSLNEAVQLQLSPSATNQSTEWVEPFIGCFGAKGVIALSFWLGSLFAVQIRGPRRSFPFLEVVGESGSGKSALLEFLWKLLGRRDYEGFNPHKASIAGRARIMCQTSNLPVVFLHEEESTSPGTFDWDETKPLFNGRGCYTRGVKHSGNETCTPPFRGTVCISSEKGIHASHAVLDRIVQLKLSQDDHTPETTRHAKQLEDWPLEQAAGFLINAISHEHAVLHLVNKNLPLHENTLEKTQGIKSSRTVTNHALLMALVDALPVVIPLSQQTINEAHNLLIDMAVQHEAPIQVEGVAQ